MTVRIATFNLENLFTRPSAMSDKAKGGQAAIDAYAKANDIIAKEIYSDEDKEWLLELNKKYKFSALNPPSNALLVLNKIRGNLFGKRNGVVTVVANGRSDWTGWFELRREDIFWEATLNTGRVIAEVNPAILVCIEVDDRPSLQRFNEQILKSVYGIIYPYFMVIDGNDKRGIDVGILSKYPISYIRSHVDDKNPDGELTFSRDCPEYQITISKTKTLVVCPNHFKSKRGGDDSTAQARRLNQAVATARIAKQCKKNVSPLVLVAGDLNDIPSSPSVAALLTTGWADVQAHKHYPTDRPGTFMTGTANHKIDYLIMSPALKKTLTDVGIERRGTYHPKLWTSFEGVNKTNEASDHHCVWADFDL